MLENRNIKDDGIDMELGTDTYQNKSIDEKDNWNVQENELVFKEIDGLDIRSFAKIHHLSIKEVETLVKNHELISRYQNGVLYVYDNKDYDTKNGYDYIVELKDVNVDVLDNSLKKIKITNETQNTEDQDKNLNLESYNENVEDEKISEEDIDSKNKTSKYYTLPSTKNIRVAAPDTENIQKYDDSVNTMGYLAVLAENLKVSKQEQIELLKLTQESIKRVVESTEKLVETKNTIIQEKDKVISSLEEKLALSNKKASLILQENEDLKILVDTLEKR